MVCRGVLSGILGGLRSRAILFAAYLIGFPTALRSISYGGG